MIRALALMCLSLLPACAPFPRLDADQIVLQDPRPPYLTGAELATLNARPPAPQNDPLQDPSDDLRTSADNLRAR